MFSTLFEFEVSYDYVDTSDRNPIVKIQTRPVVFMALWCKMFCCTTSESNQCDHLLRTLASLVVHLIGKSRLDLWLQIHIQAKYKIFIPRFQRLNFPKRQAANKNGNARLHARASVHRVTSSQPPPQYARSLSLSLVSNSKRYRGEIYFTSLLAE